MKKRKMLFSFMLTFLILFDLIPLQVHASTDPKDTVFKYFAIGNSFTNHPINNAWWGNYGMAASCRENDYVHQFESQIKPYFDSVGTEAVYYRDWEWASGGGGRIATLSQLDDYLQPDLDLVTIFLGENVLDRSWLESDYQNLVNYVKYKSPNAKIIMVGMFWQDEEIDQMKRNVCVASGIPFVDLHEIMNNEYYRANVDDFVMEDDGNLHQISEGDVFAPLVAAHLNDRGMKYLSDKLFSTYITSGGQILGNYSGMLFADNRWLYLRNGEIDNSYTGMALNDYGWWYYTNGQLDLTYTGMALNEYGWWYLRDGRVDWTYTGMALNEYGWWYYNNGQIDWTYTGWATNEYGNWWFQDGQLVW